MTGSEIDMLDILILGAHRLSIELITMPDRYEEGQS